MQEHDELFEAVSIRDVERARELIRGIIMSRPRKISFPIIFQEGKTADNPQADRALTSIVG